MHSSRQDYQPRHPFGRTRPAPGSRLLLRRSPSLLMAAALIALAVLLAPGAQPATAQEEDAQQDQRPVCVVHRETAEADLQRCGGL